jgi:hypothetical protein
MKWENRFVNSRLWESINCKTPIGEFIIEYPSKNNAGNATIWLEGKVWKSAATVEKAMDEVESEVLTRFLEFHTFCKENGID